MQKEGTREVKQSRAGVLLVSTGYSLNGEQILLPIRGQLLILGVVRYQRARRLLLLLLLLLLLARKGDQ